MVQRQRDFPWRIVRDVFLVATAQLGRSAATAEMMHRLLGRLGRADVHEIVRYRRLAQRIKTTQERYWDLLRRRADLEQGRDVHRRIRNLRWRVMDPDQRDVGGWL
jgi:hypothetical protein